MSHRSIHWLAFLTWIIIASSSPATEKSIRFDLDVLPILSDKCFHCHGPDAATRKAGLRLDTKEGAFRVKRGEAVIIPGKSQESELVRRILSEDAGEKMPPPESNRTLSSKQIETLKKWIDEGATWGQHWAFQPIQQPTLPKVQDSKWVRNEIDAFILSKLEREGMKPSPEATKESWLRRVTLDITGLPPTLTEMDAFLNDTSQKAYETVVDRLLKSPRYGERMASDWLDIARYADTHGYQMDRHRPMWPYRDWVIKAFNQNLHFDEFVTWQLAGDLLPNPSKEQRLATAFNRLHMQNEEGGIVEEEFRVAYVSDRVTTFGTAFLGLTLECCRCHDHKYDPISQKDFYSLFAFFQNIDESGQTTYFTPAMPVPTMLLTTNEQDAKIEQLTKAIESKEKEICDLRRDLQKPFEEWVQSKPKDFTITGLRASYGFDEIKNNQSPNNIDPKSPARTHESPKLIDGKFGKAVELSGENGFSFPDIGHFSRSDPFSFSLWINTPSDAPRMVVLHHSKAPIDAGSRGYELLLENGKVAFGLHHMWPGNSLKVTTKKPIERNIWTHVAITYDGSSRSSGLRMYLNGKLADADVIRDNLVKDILYEGGEPNLELGYRFRDYGFKGGKVDQLQIYDRELTSIEVNYVSGKEDLKTAWNTSLKALPSKLRDQLFDLYTSAAEPLMRQRLEELRKLRTEKSQFIYLIPEAMVMEEMTNPKPSYVLRRGAYDSPGEKVDSVTPSALPSFSKQLPKNRLGLAKWLTQKEHPLTPRVTVNRIWQMMFGKGIVETSDNFGSQGIPPTHPELLDWLARDFTEGQWDVKRLVKMIALSNTYRQSARVIPELLAKDPYNHLLARAPARRLSAEMLRDQALSVSGLLVEHLGGPSVYPYQPNGIWEEAMGRPNYPRSKGPDLYRRSLYTYWKRTAPPPVMTTFDAADKSVCTARRQITSTPLQALALLNDPQMVEAARFLGQRMMKEGGQTIEDRVKWTFRTVTGRLPNAKEVPVLIDIFNEQKKHFVTQAKEAFKLLAVGDSPTDAKLNAPDLAAATILGLTILNHDESVHRR